MKTVVPRPLNSSVFRDTSSARNALVIIITICESDACSPVAGWLIRASLWLVVQQPLSNAVSAITEAFTTCCRILFPQLAGNCERDETKELICHSEWPSRQICRIVAERV